MIFMNSFRRYPLCWLTTIVVIFLSVYKFGEMPELETVDLADKWAHMAMYAGLSLVAWWEYLRHHRPVKLSRALWWALAFPIVLGAAMEGVQALLPYRSCEFLDFLANSVGVLLVNLVAIAICARTHSSSPSKGED